MKWVGLSGYMRNDVWWCLGDDRSFVVNPAETSPIRVYDLDYIWILTYYEKIILLRSYRDDHLLVESPEINSSGDQARDQRT